VTERTAVVKLALCKWISARVKDWEAEAKADLAQMVQGDRTAALLNGYKIGTVTKCEGRRAVEVVDEQRLAEWVASRWPTEVETSVRVRPAFMRVLADRIRKHGALIDQDGEVCPWVEIGYGDPYLMTKPDNDIITNIVMSESGGIGTVLRELERSESADYPETYGELQPPTARQPSAARPLQRPAAS
jgi:hypothetical protein